MFLYCRDIQMIAVMEKSTQDIGIRSVEDTQVAAVVIVMTTEGIHHLYSIIYHLSILGDVHCDGNDSIGLVSRPFSCATVTFPADTDQIWLARQAKFGWLWRQTFPADLVAVCKCAPIAY